MNDSKHQFLVNLIKNKEYPKAYIVGKEYLEKNPYNQKTLSEMRKLSAVLRSKSIEHASKKINYSSISEYEILLKKVIKLTGESMYHTFS